MDKTRFSSAGFYPKSRISMWGWQWNNLQTQFPWCKNVIACQGLWVGWSSQTNTLTTHHMLVYSCKHATTANYTQAVKNLTTVWLFCHCMTFCWMDYLVPYWIGLIFIWIWRSSMSYSNYRSLLCNKIHCVEKKYWATHSAAQPWNPLLWSSSAAQPWKPLLWSSSAEFLYWC